MKRNVSSANVCSIVRPVYLADHAPLSLRWCQYISKESLRSDRNRISECLELHVQD